MLEKLSVAELLRSSFKGIRLVGILDTIIYKETTISYKAVATLLGAEESEEWLATLVENLDEKHRRVIVR